MITQNERSLSEHSDFEGSLLNFQKETEKETILLDGLISNRPMNLCIRNRGYVRTGMKLNVALCSGY